MSTLRVFVWDLSEYQQYHQQLNIAIANSVEEAIAQILAIKENSDFDLITGPSPVAYWGYVLREGLAKKLNSTQPQIYPLEGFALACGYFE